uniref:Uncharacterized protein n=1 Tax=Kwoniella bestiolae CBS 10118 TaxID=1296100 RepID=A0A1B9G0J1_9TREE|nr:hypothetical protein I302_05996 [Kwoniella bestiolae CBS 10118]OCF24535.1 hypothetical protein I302_05996 [Kwoniella bestiolae CBS 10118]
MILLSSIHNPPLTPPPASPPSHFVSRADRLRRYISFDSVINTTSPVYFPLPVPNLELHSAAASGNVGLVHYALTHGQPVNSVLHGVLPLHAACSGGSVSVVRMLIENGADVNAPRLPRRYSDGKKGTAPSVGTAGSTPLHFAAANGHAPIVQMLLASGADPIKPDKNGNTPEDLAVINGHEDVVRVLHVYHHLQNQDALNDPANSDKAEPSSPSGSTSQLPDDDDSSINVRPAWHIGSRKGKERAFSLTSTRSESAVKVKKSLEGLLRRGSRYSAGAMSSDYRSANDSPRSEASGSVNNPNTIPRISTVSDISSINSEQLQSPVDLDIPGSPSPQKGENTPLAQIDNDNTGQGSPRSLTRVLSGQSSNSNSTSIVLGSPPNSAGLASPKRARHNSTSSHRPTLPSILEKAVHPGQAFRAAMRHQNQSTHEHDNASHHSSSGGGFFRGRRKSHDSDAKKHGHGHHKHGFRGLFRRGHSPPSRSPSPPMKSDSTKPIAGEELEEGIERLKRASLELDRAGQVIDSAKQVPFSAPATKTKFFPDSPTGPPRLPTRNSEGLISSASSPGLSHFNRPRTGSEVIAPSPLANEWAHDEDSDSSLHRQGIRRVKTEIIKSPVSSSPLSPESDVISPTSPTGARRRSATHSGGLPSPPLTNFTKSLNPPKVTGLGWEGEVDLRKVAASGLIRRESQRRQAEFENEMEAEDEEYHDALSPGVELAEPISNNQEREEDNDSTPTPQSGITLNDPTPTEDRQQGRLRGESVGSFTTDSSRLSTPPAPSSAQFRMSSITDDTEETNNRRLSQYGTLSNTADGRPRGKSVSSISSTASGMGYSYAQSTSTPPTSLTTPSALSLALVSGFPPVPEDEVAHVPPSHRRTMTQRTISSHAEAREVVKQNESDILQLAQLPPSLDSSRSLAEQLAAYGENYAIERQFAEIERRSTSGQTPTGRSEDGESFFSAEGSNRSWGSSKSSERRGPGSIGGLQPRAVSHPLVPLVSVDAPRSSLPSINSIYDKRAEAYRKHMATLTSVQPLLSSSSSSTRHAQHRARQRAVSAQDSWLNVGLSARPGSAHSTAGNSLLSYTTANEEEERIKYPHISNPLPVMTNPVTGQRPRKSSVGASHSRGHTLPRASSVSNPTPIADILSTRYQGIAPSTGGAGGNSKYATAPIGSTTSSQLKPPSIAPGVGSSNTATPMGISSYVSIFSNRYQPKVPLNDDDSDDENDNNREYTVIENDWRGGHVVRPDELGLSTGNEGVGGKKKWGLKRLGRK